MSAPLSPERIAEILPAAQRALEALEDLIADSRDPGVEALGARYELAHALGRVSPNELPLDEPGFSSPRMEAENYRKLYHSARDRADSLADALEDRAEERTERELELYRRIAQAETDARNNLERAEDAEQDRAELRDELKQLRAEVLLEAANALANLGPVDSLVSAPQAWNEAIDTLRRMAAEAGESR